MKASENSPVESGSRVIFALDSDTAVLKALKMLFGTLGLTTLSFQTAKSLLKQMEEVQPVCVVAEIHMPDMDGLKLVETIRAKTKNLPIILLATHSDVRTAVRAIHSGATDFIEKPFTERILLDRVEQAIRQCERPGIEHPGLDG